MIAFAPAPALSRLGFRSVAVTHPGRRREVNQDRVLDRCEAQLWAVADGMGGHQDGERAATLVVDALSDIDHGASGYACLAEVERRLQRVNAELAGASTQQTCGSTLVALLAHDNHFACLWAGDSRAYRWRDGVLTAITRDHSLVQELVDNGTLPASARRGDRRSHVITRAVGAAPTLVLDRHFAPVRDGDVFLLCSDGLTGCVEDGEIAQVLRDRAIGEASDALLQLALRRGAPDNVSLVLIQADRDGCARS